MIPPIAKFTIIMNVVLTIIVGIDVFKELNLHESNVPPSNLSNRD